MLYLACLDDPPPEFAVDCVATVLVEPPAGFLPPLSIEDAGLILGAVCGVLALAWVFSQLRRVGP